MKLSDLLQFDNIIVQCHDNPDADALASGFGVYEYLRMNGKSPRLVYGGRNIIHKSNLVLMVDSLGIPIEHVDFLDNPQLLVTVDCQYGGGECHIFQGRKCSCHRSPQSIGRASCYEPCHELYGLMCDNCVGYAA